MVATKLGDLKPNIYSLNTVQKALNGVLADKNRIASNGVSRQATLNPTHYYVRFAPQSMEQLVRLEEADFVLYDVPLTADIALEGDFYQDPSIPADQITYQYTLIPHGFPLPADIPHTILDLIFLYNDDDGEEQEPDTWGGGNICPAFEQAAGVPVDCISPTGGGLITQSAVGNVSTLREYYNAKGDAVKQATKTIKDLGVKPAELYAATAQLVNFDPEAEEGIALQSGNRYKPEGTIRIFNTELNTGVPLHGAKVLSRNFLKLGDAYTDENGRFRITKGYRKRANIKVVAKNPIVSIRSLHTWWQPWQAVLNTRHDMGSFERSGLENISFTFQTSPLSGNHTSRKWAAFTSLGTLMHAWVSNNRDDFEYNFPYVKMLLTDAPTESGITPMSTYLIKSPTGATELVLLFDLLKEVLKKETKKLTDNNPLRGGLIKIAVDAILPDMVYAYGGPDGNTTLSSQALQNGVYRQAGRATHYYSLLKTISPTSSTASNYWWRIQKRMFENRVTNNAPPFGTKTSQDAGAIAVIESHAYYYGNMRNSERYGTGIFLTLGGFPISDAERNQIENQRLNNNIAISVMGSGLNTWYEGWIPCGLLHDVGDIGENTAFTGITDAADAYNRIKIYYAIKNTTHADVNSFVSTLLNTGFSAQQTQIRSLQTQYGY